MTSLEEAKFLLTFDLDNKIAFRAAKDWKAPISLLIFLAKSKDHFVRRNVAQNEKTPASVLVQLAKDKDHLVRRYAANNPSMPAGAQAGLPMQELVAH